MAGRRLAARSRAGSRAAARVLDCERLRRTPMRLSVVLCLAHTVAAAPGDTCDFNLFAGTSCTQTAFAWANTTSAANCCDACTAHAGCKAWEWVHGNAGNHEGNCHMKAQPGPMRRQAGTTCGVSKTLPSPPAPPPPPAPLPPAPPAPAGSPNIIWFLTDDQDQKLGGSFPQLGGVGPMPKTKALLADQGATASNWFIHTPICCEYIVRPGNPDTGS